MSNTMTPFEKEIWQAVNRTMYKKLFGDEKLKSIEKALGGENADYETVNQYSIRYGELLSESLLENLNIEKLPDDFISRNLIQNILDTQLGNGYTMVKNKIIDLQKKLNDKSEIGLQPQVAEIDNNRIQGLVDKVASYNTIEESQWVLKEPIINYHQAIIDYSIKANMDVQSKAGMSPKIIRKAESGACKWCRALAGTYDYKDVRAPGSYVYRRHAFCRCEVTYVNGKKRQDVYSKAEWQEDEENARVKAIEQKQLQTEQEQKLKNIDRMERTEAVDRMIQELGFSPKGASIAYNQYKNEISKYGLDRVIEAMQGDSRFNTFKSTTTIKTVKGYGNTAKVSKQYSIPQDFNNKIQAIEVTTKASRELALDYSKAVYDFTGTENYKYIRELQVDGSLSAKTMRKLSNKDYELVKKEANDIEEFIKNAPKYEGKTYRGMTLKSKDLKDILNSDSFDMAGVSSWSSDVNVADKFATKDGGYQKRVVFVCENQTKGTPIKYLSHFPNEEEVLVSQKAKYRVTGTNERTVKKKFGTATILEISVEEIID